MANYGLTALSGLSGSLDRQDRRNDMQDQRDWLKESREMQRTQFKNQQEDRAAGAENQKIALKNQKMQGLLQQADLERKQMIQKLDKSLRVIAMEGGNKNDHGKAMAEVLSTMHGKPIEYSPSEFTGRGQDHRGFQFKSQDGKIYSFEDYQDAKDKIGSNFEDNYEFLRNKSAALNEEGLWVTQEGKLVQAKRGEAEKQGFTPYALVKAQGEMLAIGRKNQGTYKTVETDKGIVAYNEQNPNQQVALGRAPVSEADRAEGANANVKITKQFKDDLAFVLTPFAKPGMDMTALFDGGELTEPAKNALESAISFYERNSNVPKLPPQDKMKLQKAKDAIRLYNHMSQTVRNRYDLGDDADTPTLNVGSGGSSYGRRADGTEKGSGYFGELKRPDGNISTEISVGVEMNGKETEIPLLVPTLTKAEVTHLLSGKPATAAIMDKAVKHARERISSGKSPFAEQAGYDTTTPTALGLLKGSSPKDLSSGNTHQGEQGYQGPKYVDGEDAQAMDSQPPIAGAKQAPDGNWYVPDPNRPGKYMRVFMGGIR